MEGGFFICTCQEEGMKAKNTNKVEIGGTFAFEGKGQNYSVWLSALNKF